MDCTGLFLAELDFAVLCWSSLDGGGGGGKRKLKQCSGRPETAIDLTENLRKHSVGVSALRERGG